MLRDQPRTTAYLEAVQLGADFLRDKASLVDLRLALCSCLHCLSKGSSRMCFILILSCKESGGGLGSEEETHEVTS